MSDQVNTSEQFQKTITINSSIKCSQVVTSKYPLQIVYREVANFYKEYIEFQDQRTYPLFSIWSLGTHVFDIFRSYPYLYLIGVKAGGKSKVLTMTSLFAKDPLFTAGISPAALYRKIEKSRPTILMDEVESLSRESSDDLRLIAQAGYKKGGKVIRCVGKNFEPKEFEIYSPKAFASINVPNDIFESRCIPVIMRRTMNRKIANREIKIDDNFWNNYNVACNGSIVKVKDIIKEVYEKIEDEKLFGRDWELWKPLLSIAKVISEDVYTELREYALDVSKQRKEDESDTVKICVVRCLLELADKDDWYSNKQIFELVKKDFEWMTAQKLGYHMKALGFRSKAHGSGKGYDLNIVDIKKVAESLGIEIEVKKEADPDE
ncbi:MAG: hypothetical protein KJ906_00540 [Nanoarchaeota archaeon]|nr:hypothetical protein [Nanoarchaeota archaeon]